MFALFHHAKHHAKRVTKFSVWYLVISLIIVSILGGYLGARGNRVPVRRYPIQPYEQVTFTSQAWDALQLTGWYFPGGGPKTVVIVHGWGGNRARLLDLAQYLQRRNINVLTFDLRGGTGRNSYGEHESGDLAGAVDWLTNAKQTSSNDISLIGASMGGAASIIYAANHPIDRMILLSPVSDIRAAKRLILQNYLFIFPQLYAAGATVIERVFYDIRPTNPVDVFNKIEAPALIFHAEDDNIVPVSGTRALETIHRNQGKTNGTFVYLPTGGHKYIDSDPELGFPFAKRISDFIVNE